MRFREQISSKICFKGDMCEFSTFVLSEVHTLFSLSLYMSYLLEWSASIDVFLDLLICRGIHSTMKNIEQAINDIRDGKFIVIIDDKSSKKSGALVASAERVTPDALSFLSRNTTGITYVCLPKTTLERFEIPDFPQNVAYNASVDYRHQRKTGMSPNEKYRTIRALISSDATAADMKRPGNVFPLSYQRGGVLARLTVAEAGVDMSRLAGLMEAAVFGEVANEEGSLASIEQIQGVVKREHLTAITLTDLVAYRWSCENLVKEISRARIPTDFGDFTMILYGSIVDDVEHIAMVKGEFSEEDEVLVRIHSECLTGEIFGSRRCDCGNQLRGAMEKISQEGKGALIYMRGHEGRGIGLAHKLKAYCLQDEGKDTVEANIALGFPADKREYGIGAQMLRSLGIKKIKLLTNNPKKGKSLQGYGFDIVQRIPLVCELDEHNRDYLETKKKKMGHILGNLE